MYWINQNGNKKQEDINKEMVKLKKNMKERIRMYYNIHQTY